MQPIARSLNSQEMRDDIKMPEELGQELIAIIVLIMKTISLRQGWLRRCSQPNCNELISIMEEVVRMNIRLKVRETLEDLQRRFSL